MMIGAMGASFTMELPCSLGAILKTSRNDPAPILGGIYKTSKKWSNEKKTHNKLEWLRLQNHN